MTARPFLRWAGGKGHLVHELLKHVPEALDTYHEPFLGGGALFFALQPKRAVLSDANQELMTTFSAIRDELGRVVRPLRRYEKDHGPELYAKMVSAKWLLLPRHLVAARMIYLNRACFNGLYRVNSSGRFNVPMDTTRASISVDYPNLRACSEALKRAELVCDEFSGTIARAMPGDFVYADPPFVPRGGTASFTAYTAGGFSIRDHAALVTALENAKNRGVSVLASNADLPLVRELYKGFQFQRITARRNINSKGSARGPIGELLIW